MNRMKYFSALALLLCALMLGGCASALLGAERTQDSASAGATVSADASTVVVAEINGQKVYKDEYDSFYDQLLYYAYYNGQDIESEEVISSVRQEALAELISQKVCEQKFEALGYYAALTEEDKAQAESEMMEYLVTNVVEAYYLSEVTANLPEGYTDEELRAAEEAYAETLFEGSGMTREEYLDTFIYPIVYDKAFAGEVGDIVPTEAEVQTKYNEYIAADEASISADPASYISAVNEGATMYYTPAGVRMVRQVLVLMDEETMNAISLLRSNSYDASADILLTGGLDAIEERANEVLGKLQSGELTFDEAIAQYNDDTGMPEEGYPVMSGTDAYVTSFTEASMSLTAIGSYTALIASDYGYHIIEYYTDVEEGSVPYDSVRDAILSELQTTMQEEAWDALRQQWETESQIVRYEENL